MSPRQTPLRGTKGSEQGGDERKGTGKIGWDAGSGSSGSEVINSTSLEYDRCKGHSMSPEGGVKRDATNGTITKRRPVRVHIIELQGPDSVTIQLAPLK